MEFRSKTVVMGQIIDVTSLGSSDGGPRQESVSVVHSECGGVVVEDADFIAGEEDEIWWNYRCQKCGETFQDSGEWL